MRIRNAFGKVIEVLESVFASAQRERRLPSIDSISPVGKC